MYELKLLARCSSEHLGGAAHEVDIIVIREFSGIQIRWRLFRD